jgi:hypothetical protein
LNKRDGKQCFKCSQSFISINMNEIVAESQCCVTES